MCGNWYLCKNCWSTANGYDAVNLGTSFRTREYEYGTSHHCRVICSVSSDLVEGLLRNDSVFV